MKMEKNFKELDYVKIYARALKVNPRLFKQQAMLINSQIEASSSLFKKKFGVNFKEGARNYLKKIKILV